MKTGGAARPRFDPQRYERDLLCILSEVRPLPAVSQRDLQRVLRKYPRDGKGFFSRSELIAAHQSVEEIRQHIDADTLGYLSVEGTIAATRQGPGGLCTACFTGEYPGAVPLQFDKFVLETNGTRDRHAVPLAPVVS